MQTNKVSDDYIDSFGPVQVYVEGDNIEGAIRIFRQQVTKERIMSVLKEHAYYEKPSEKRRRKARESRQRQKKIELLKIKGFDYDDDI